MATRKPAAKKAGPETKDRLYTAIVKVMRDSGINGMEYHRKTGLHQATISQILNGRRKRPSAEFAAKIAKASGLTAEEFGKLMYRSV